MEELDDIPNLPVIVAAVEFSLEEFDDLDDFSNITKRKLALNQMCLFDTVLDICKYVSIKFHQVDLLKKGIESINTKLTELLEEDNSAEEIKDKLTDLNANLSMYN